MKPYIVVLCAILLTCHLTGAGSASFEIWNDATLTKLSSNTTDSVVFQKLGSVGVVQCEVRQAFNGRPTRRLQISLNNFTGVGTYDVSSSSTFWENFSQTNTCDCIGAAINIVKVLEYDSVKKSIKGTFEFKCHSFSNTGDELKYRVRAGSFDAGDPKIALDLLPKDTVQLRIAQQDTVIGIRIKSLDAQGQPIPDVKIFVNDKFATNSNAFTLANSTSSSGVYVYSTTVPWTTPSGEYTIKIYAEKSGMRSSDTMTVLYRYGKRYFDYMCGGLPILTFDAGPGKEWKTTSGSPIISTDSTVTIGRVLKMDGQVRIDTTPGAIRVFGGSRVYLPLVHFDDGTEDFVLPLTVTDAFPMPDCEGLIKMATEKRLTKKLPGGIEMSLTQFSIINRPDAMGLKLGAKISMKNAKTGCSSNGTTDTSSVEISVAVTTSGFEQFSLSAEKVSLTPVFCLEEFHASADFVNKEYYLGGKAKFPLKATEIGVEGGALFKNNPANPDGKIHLDSLLFGLTDSTCRYVIPDAPFCFKGIALSTSGLSGATWNGATFRGTLTLNSAEQVILSDARFRWLSSLLGSPAIAELEGTIQYRHPLIFTGALTTRVAKLAVISESKPWQIEGTQSITLDCNSNIAFNGSFKMGHLGADDYFLNVNGNMTLQWIPVLGVSASVSGAVRIPAPSAALLAQHPFAGAPLRMMQLSGIIPSNLGSGSAMVSENEDDGFLLSTDVDVSQHPNPIIRSFGRLSMKMKYKDHLEVTTSTANVQPSRTKRSGVEIQGSRRSDYICAAAVDTITVDESIERLFIFVSGPTTAPASSITDPAGTSFTTSDEAKGILRFASPNGELIQWSIINPVVGKWIVRLTNPGPLDSVSIMANRKSVPFAITATQTAQTITVTWPVKSGGANDIVRLYLDSDTSGLNGIYIGQSLESTGMYRYTLPATLTECAYYVYATRAADGLSLTSSYATMKVTGNGSPIAAPTNLSAVSNQFGTTVLQWKKASDPAITGYSIYVRDENGVDSLYALIFASEESVTLQIDNQAKKKIYMYSFIAGGARSCASEFSSVVTSVQYESGERGDGLEQDVMVIPNPANSVTTVLFRGTESEAQSVEVLNPAGVVVARLTARQSATVTMEAKWNTSELSDGVYFISVRTASGVKLAKIAVLH